MRTSTSFRLLAVAPRIWIALPLALRRCVGNGDFQRAGEILAGERFRRVRDLLRLARGDEMAAGVARAGAEVDDVIGAANGVFVVLDDEHGVAEIAQVFERAEQAVVVARVQADGGLVENIEHAAKARADLRGQANALGFAAGKRGGGAIEAEIAEADGEQEIEALGDFFQRTSGDLFLARR